ncbi:hypothetical protein M2152_002723 [Microbacteriaceae bacterium SG_E_30_P1]|uniref:Uncharacterized protein n=1 Tax=Antiquaquibacter oligotrophicus TaxID=2880260 RepID=A0ABT6KRD8_9MICO|nr:hypothetical protein [Antiquaquibacter oligotrophicus]MDH6182541.1 hypothetical protein [Antiquaquibacter oligotrophicus]
MMALTIALAARALWAMIATIEVTMRDGYGPVATVDAWLTY